MTDHLADFPSTIELSRSQPARRYVRRAEVVAVHGPLPSRIPADNREELAPGIVLVPAALAGRLGADAHVTAVYSIGETGQPLAPTGRVLVRFPESDLAEAHREAIANTGYRLAESLPYAPHAAWVQSPEGTGRALRDLPRLEALPDAVAIEPEMVARRQTR